MRGFVLYGGTRNVMSPSWIEIPDHAEQPALVSALELDTLAPGALHRLGVVLMNDSASRPIRVPALVARGAHPGPTVGITAAIHGNELNGIFTIHRLFERIDPAHLRGNVVGVTIANVPAYLADQRRYTDGQDLNHIMPGKPNGNQANLYANRLFERVIRPFDVLIDLHTASFGRVNTLYIRADMRDPKTALMARSLGAEIIVHNPGTDGTLRAAATAIGQDAITVEIGDPQVFDADKVRDSRIGLRDILEDLGMLEGDHETTSRRAVECSRSYWLFTDTGGLLEPHIQLGQQLSSGAPIASLWDPWGQRLRVYRAPEDCIVIGYSTNPAAHSGSRIAHLGIVGPP